MKKKAKAPQEESPALFLMACRKCTRTFTAFDDRPGRCPWCTHPHPTPVSYRITAPKKSTARKGRHA